MISKLVLRTTALLGICFLLPACYYVQATRGQIEVLSKRQPIDEVLASPDTAEELGRRLRLVQEARQFSIDELYLPDNKSYRSYSDLERDFVVWNVFAAPEFSLEAREWCYPIVGCVSYRGYFSEEAANGEAAKLRRKGFDSAVGGVPAYSTLGNFNDPVLELSNSELLVNGKRGEARLSFDINEAGGRVGSGFKKLLLSGLREYEHDRVEVLRDEYLARRAAYQAP